MRISTSEALEKKASAFADQFKMLNAADLNLDAYNQKYLRSYQSKVLYPLYLACQLLDQVRDIHAYRRLIDYGGGIGFNTALYANLFPELEIIYLDIDPQSAISAQQVHKALDIRSVQYITGDIDAVEDLLDQQTLVLSRDVIEHIYDLERFFALSSKAGKNIHNTAAMKPSLFRSAEFKNIHRKAEQYGNAAIIKKQRDGSQAYFQRRLEIIEALFPDKSKTEAVVLAKRSRGLIRVDIQRFVKDSVYPKHHLKCLHDNSCDPDTGNWAERCLSKKDYRLYAGPLTLHFSYPKWNALDAEGWRRWVLRSLNIFATTGLHGIQPSLNIVY